MKSMRRIYLLQFASNQGPSQTVETEYLSVIVLTKLYEVQQLST